MKYFRSLFIASIIFLSLPKTVYAAAAGSDDHEGDAFFARAVALEQETPAESHSFITVHKRKINGVRLIIGKDGLPVAVKKERRNIHREAFVSCLSQILGLNNVARSKIIKDGSEEFLFEEYVRWRTEGEDPESEAYKIAEKYEQKGSLCGAFLPEKTGYNELVKIGDTQKLFMMTLFAGLYDIAGRNTVYRVEDGFLRPIIIDTVDSFAEYTKEFIYEWRRTPTFAWIQSIEEGHAELDPALRELILSWNVPEILKKIERKFKEIIQIRKPKDTEDQDAIDRIISQKKDKEFKEFGVKLWTVQKTVREYAGASIFFLEDLFHLLFGRDTWNRAVFSDRKQPIKLDTELKRILWPYKSEVRELIVGGMGMDYCEPSEIFFCEKYPEFVNEYLESLYKREETDGIPPAVDLIHLIQAYIKQGNNTHAETGEKATVESILEASAWDIRPIEIEAGTAGAAAAASAASSDTGAKWVVSLRE